MPELEPNLFETDFNVYALEGKQRTAVENDKTLITYEMKLRVDSRYHDKVLARAIPMALLKAHGFESRDEFFSCVLDATRNQKVFDVTFKDHRVSFGRGGQTLSTFSNISINKIWFEQKHFNLYIELLAYGVKGKDVGKIVDVMGGQIHATFLRAEHWSKQDGLGLDEEPEGDADKQTDLTDEQRTEIEKNKDKTNKTNTDKAHGREPESA